VDHGDPGLLLPVFRRVFPVIILATVFSVSSFRKMMRVRKLPSVDFDSSVFLVVGIGVLQGIDHFESLSPDRILVSQRYNLTNNNTESCFSKYESRDLIFLKFSGIKHAWQKSMKK
jgi:hypothetical protein